MFEKLVELLVPKLTAGQQIRLLILVAIAALAGFVVRWVLEFWKLEFQHRQKLVQAMSEYLHRYISKYYFPIINAMASFQQSLAGSDGGKDGDDETRATDAFHRLSLLLATIALVRRRLGGIFLRNLTAEIVLSTLYVGHVQKEIDRHLTRAVTSSRSSAPWSH